MKIPCIKRLDFITSGLLFVLPAMSQIQFNNLTLVATALVLGSRFKLTAIRHMWLNLKAVSTLSYFFADSKMDIQELQRLYIVQVLSLYNTIEEGRGYFIIDDTMKHHTKFCKWIHGVCVLFDHVFKTNLKAICIVFLYYSDGELIKFPITYRIFYKESGSKMPWQKEEIQHKTKNELALEMIQQVLNQGFPKSIVLADSWFCVEPFIKGLQKLRLSYVLEAKSGSTIAVPYKTPKLTKKGKLAKKQFELVPLSPFFASISEETHCGFPKDLETGKEEKLLYHLKVATVKLNALMGKHRILQSTQDIYGNIKYFLTNELNWEAKKMISIYSNRWVIEEFFRNAKQLSDMEGTCLRSQQGVALSLCLVSWIDFLLHRQNYQSAIKGHSKGSITIPSIIRKAQLENMESFIQQIQTDENFVQKWVEVVKEQMTRPRKTHKELVELEPVLKNDNPKSVESAADFLKIKELPIAA